MGTFFAEVQLAAAARPERRETVKLLVDPVQRRLIPAILYGACLGAGLIPMGRA